MSDEEDVILALPEREAMRYRLMRDAVMVPRALLDEVLEHLAHDALCRSSRDERVGEGCWRADSDCDDPRHPDDCGLVVSYLSEHATAARLRAVMASQEGP